MQRVRAARCATCSVRVMAACALAGCGCEREARRYQELPAAADRETGGPRRRSSSPGRRSQQAPSARARTRTTPGAWAKASGSTPPTTARRATAQRRRRDRSAADGRQVDLRRAAGSDLRDDLAGAARRHAVVRRPHPDAADLAARRLRQSMSGQVPRRPRRRAATTIRLAALPESRQSPQAARADGAPMMPSHPVGAPSRRRPGRRVEPPVGG